MDLMARLMAHGGAARRSQLLRTTADRRALLEGLESRILRDLGGGWVSVTDADKAIVAARRFNGTVTCVSAAPFYGLRLLTTPERVHVAVPRSRGARPNDLRRRLTVHRESSWTRPGDAARPVAPLDEVLARVVRCLPEDESVIMLDSALNQRLISTEEVARIVSGPGSVRARSALARCDAGSRSATETLARLALRDAGFTVDAAVPIATVGEVDLVVDGCVVVECDGFSYHSGRREYREDRRRDRRLVALGYIVLRFTWEDVMHDPQCVVRAVRAALDGARAQLRRHG